MFEWTVGNTYNMLVTLYPNNLTLNNVAAAHFNDCRYCLLGLDRLNKLLAIKSVTKEEIDLQTVPLSALHRIFIGKGYARISNKSFISDIYKLLDCGDKGLKFNAEFDEREKMLIVDLKKRG